MRDIKKVVLLLSSPGDVSEERKLVSDVTAEYNDVWGEFLGIEFDVFKWEEDAVPTISTDPQNAINAQIPNDYDIFVGILFARFGTPTPRAESGTEEEFLSAIERHKSGEPVDVMLYFRSSDLPRSVDPSQLEKVNAFRQNAATHGVFYREFLTTKQFEQFVRMHLSRKAQEISHRLREKVTMVAEAQEDLIGVYIRAVEAEEQEGNLNHSSYALFSTDPSTVISANNQATYYFEQANDAIDDINEALIEHTKDVHSASENLTKLPQKYGKNIIRPAMQLERQLARKLSNTSQQLSRHSADFLESSEKGIDILISMLRVPIVIDLRGYEYSDEFPTYEFEGIVDSLSRLIQSVGELGTKIESVISLTPEFNKARYALVNTIGSMEANYRSILSLWSELSSLVKSNFRVIR